MKIVAHRGFAGLYPEMTRTAFQRALELPIHGVECDVRLTRDGHVVCHHDLTVDRTSDGHGRVKDMTLAQLRELNFGTSTKREEILLLDDLLDLVEGTGKHLYIETKHPGSYGRILDEQVALRLRYRGLTDADWIHIISFSLLSVARMRHLLPRLDRFALRRDWYRYLGLDPRWGKPAGMGLSLFRARLHPKLIGVRNLPTYLWTIDDPEDMVWVRDHGADILATNRPDLALDAVR